MEHVGSDRLRLTPHQKLVVLDVPGRLVRGAVTRLDKLGLSTAPSPFRRHTMACTGIEYCKLAIVETKATAATTIAALEQRLADVAPQLDTPISLNVNGCPNSCARIQVADIGLKGQLVLDDDGNQVEGFQVHLGGSIGFEGEVADNFGRKLRAHKVTSVALGDYVTTVVRNYLVDRSSSAETFAQWVARAEEVLLYGEKQLDPA
jgi:sulfite reductase (ferredoxin)